MGNQGYVANKLTYGSATLPSASRFRRHVTPATSMAALRARGWACGVCSAIFRPRLKLGRRGSAPRQAV